jgi:hypothetical protein
MGCAGCSGRISTTSPPNKQTTACQRQSWQACTDDGTGDKLGSELTTRIDHCVNVKIALSAQDSRDQRRLGLRDRPALERDEGRIVDQRLRQIEDLRGHDGANDFQFARPYVPLKLARVYCSEGAMAIASYSDLLLSIAVALEAS